MPEQTRTALEAETERLLKKDVAAPWRGKRLGEIGSATADGRYEHLPHLILAYEPVVGQFQQRGIHCLDHTVVTEVAIVVARHRDDDKLSAWAQLAVAALHECVSVLARLPSVVCARRVEAVGDLYLIRYRRRHAAQPLYRP